VIVPLPSSAALVDFLGEHPVLVVVLVFVAVVIWPAVWSRRPARRCAAAAVLTTLIDGIAAIAQLVVMSMLTTSTARPAVA
jgi:hypothetical protein